MSINQHEQDLLEGFGEAIRWAGRTYPDHQFHIRIDDDAGKDRREFAVVIDNLKYFMTFPHATGVFGVSEYCKMAERFIIRNMEETRAS